MTVMQLILLAGVVCLFALTVAATLLGWATRRECAVLLALWIAAALGIAFPEETTRIARAVGVGRGTDLLLYCSVLAMMGGFLMVYARLRALRREMTLLVRHLAIRGAIVTTDRQETPGDPPPPRD